MGYNDAELDAVVAREQREVKARRQADFDAAERKRIREMVAAGEREQVERRKIDAAKAASSLLDERVRRSYFAANPGGSENSFLAIRDELRKQIILNDAVEADRARRKLHTIYSDF